MPPRNHQKAELYAQNLNLKTIKHILQRQSCNQT